ncbi:unnamed protein product [Orchesella dallaii]|uniref:Chitotriosidase-1 n=1 Tax=Orchesella dallaii TaxID=48710 RepID=A0ABP1R8V8_9HEXA
MRDPSGSAGRSESSQPAPNPAINDELQFSPVSITTSQSSTRHRQCQLVSRNMSLNRIVTLALLVLCSFFVGSTSAKSNEKRVVCYYTNWSAYRQGPAKFLPDNINPYLCTHLVYAFGGLTSDSGIKPFDKYQDIDKGGYTKFNGLKTYNKALKTLIAIGGWNEGSRRFSNLVSASESRKTFIKHAIRFLRQYHFDGLDLDWEYPASREGGVPEDKKNYALFIKELREAFEEESKSTGRARLLLTIAVPAGIEWITKGFDIPVINRNVDFFNLLTYDYHASTEPNANHHAPLKARSGLSEYDWKGQLNIEFTISHYLKEGAEPDKLVVGLPTYGRSYTLFNTDSHDVDAPSSGPGTKGKFTKEPGYLAYYEVCEGVKSGDWRVENGDSDVQGPHAVNGDQWVGYDDPRIMGVKGKWVKDNGLGGIMFWSVDNDDFRGTCHGKPFPLIESAKAAYYTGDAPGQSPQRPSSTSLTSRFSKPSTATSTSTNARNRFSNLSLANRRFTTPPPPSTTTGSSTKSSKGRRRNKNKKRNKKRNNRNKSRTTAEPATTTTTSTTTTTPAPTFSPFNTPAPPTTPDPGVDFECKEDGFFPHPSVCKKYFWCLDAPGLGLVAHHFTCPAGLYFNKNTDSCDYARNVPCKPGVQATTTTTPTTTTSTTTTTRPTTRPTTTRTTTTTTTQAPEEEEDDEYYDDEEDDEGGEDTEEEEEDEADEGDAATDNSGKSVKEINDIKDLLKLIKKLGGVEELEKFFEENPSIAAAAAEFEKQDKTKPKSKYTPSTSLNTRNRFTPTTTSSSTTSNSNRSRFGSSTNLKYTTITRNKNPQRPVDMTEEEADSDDSDDKPKTKSTTRTTTQTTSTPLRQKYVTLSRNSNASRNKNRDSSSSTPTPTPSPIPESTNSKLRQNSVASSSTETSVVVRYSNDDAFILPDSADSNGGDQVETDDDNVSKNRASLSSSVARLLSSNPPSSSSSSNKNSDNKSSNRYVTISRPYARVAGTVDGDTVVGDSTSNTGTLNAQNSRQRYVAL